jgi:hypothetical protein
LVLEDGPEILDEEQDVEDHCKELTRDPWNRLGSVATDPALVFAYQMTKSWELFRTDETLR